MPASEIDVWFCGAATTASTLSARAAWIASPAANRDARPLAALVEPKPMSPTSALGQATSEIAPSSPPISSGRSITRIGAAIPQALAWRATTVGSPNSSGRHNARTPGSSAAFMLISGPMPAGSPVAMAMMGSVAGIRDHIRLHRAHERLSRLLPFRVAYDLQECRRDSRRLRGSMDDLRPVLEDLITANRILAHEKVLDSFGHVSIRHPKKSDRFLLSRARAPQMVQVEDIMEFTLDGTSVGREPGKPYSERFIHAALYEARPEVNAVVHNHSPSVIPFSVTKTRRMRPIMHMCAPIGSDIPTWDIRDTFGDRTNLLVTDLAMARDLAKCLGANTVALMRGHGSTVVARDLREVVFTSVYMEMNANLLMQSLTLGDGEVTYLSDGEIEAITKGRAGFTFERGWENWCNKVGRPYVAREWVAGEGFSRTDGNFRCPRQRTR